MPESDSLRVSARIKSLLDEAGLSPEVASKRSGLSRNTVRNWIQPGGNRPRASALRAFEAMISIELRRPVVIQDELEEAGPRAASQLGSKWIRSWPVSPPPSPDEFFMWSPRLYVVSASNQSTHWVRDIHLFMRIEDSGGAKWPGGWRAGEVPMGELPPGNSTNIEFTAAGGRVGFVAYQFKDADGSVWIREWNGNTHLAWFSGMDVDQSRVTEDWWAALNRVRRESVELYG